MVPDCGDYYFYVMKWFLEKNRKTLFISGLITAGLTLLLVQLGYVILNPGNMGITLFILINILGLAMTWGILYFLLARYAMFQVFGVIGLLVTGVLAEDFLPISKNPITIPFLMLFWISIAYLLLPQFFKKYSRSILLIYGVVIAYYFFSFLFTTDYGGNDRADFAKYMLLPIPVFLGLWIFEQWRWVRTLKADRTRAELALLKSQVNPHFFFNTLNNLYGLVVEKSPQAPEVVLQLSNMMRYTIDMGREDEVNIMDEINYLENYIALHKIRHNKKVDIRFEHEVDSDLRVAPLLFINLLENAFKHGAESLTEYAHIHLSLVSKGNRLKFKITNNYEVKVCNKSSGTGLDNLKKRLKHGYPNKHELEVSKSEDSYTVKLNLILTQES